MPVTLKHLNPRELKPASYNPRTIGEVEREALKRGMAEFGVIDPIVARAEDLLVLGGHQRLLVAIELGLAKIPVALVSGLDDDRAAAVNVLLNNPRAQGSWDMAALSDVLSELDAHGFDASLTGFSEDELKGILTWTPDPERAGDEAEDVDLTIPEKPESVRGDVYVLGRHRLMCGDSTATTDWDVLMNGATADLVWTDPPYGVSYVGKTKDALTIQNDSLNASDLEDFLRASLGCVWAQCRPGAAWYVAAPAGPLFLPFAVVLTELKVWRQTIQWVKNTFVLGRSDYHYRHEAVFHGAKEGDSPAVEEKEGEAVVYGWKEGAAHTWRGGRKQDTIWEVARPSRSAEHPTMKPLELIRRALLNSSDAGAVVVDAFGGSGSTLIAAAQTGRTAYVMELDPRYCDVIRNRYAALVAESKVAA